MEKLNSDLNGGIGVWLRNNWALLLAIAVAIFATVTTLQNVLQPLLEQHGFRQTQTALTSYWMIEDGWKLAYETPVGGYPWTIPFEFPIYQAIVALISYIFGSPLSATGRFVSFIFLLASAWPALMIGRRLSIKREVVWIFCALLWSSPLYLFWGRTFMIETTSVFLALLSIAYAMDLTEPSPKLRSVVLFIIFATLGMLQKVTTTAPVLLVLSFVILIDHLKNNGFTFPSRRKFVLVFISFLIPFAIALLWTIYTDDIKSQSAFGSTLTSEALSKWNYGPLAQRVDLDVLQTIFWDRIMTNNIAGYLGIGILILGLIFAKRSARRIILISILLFALPIFIFMNLHRVHTYYQLSSTLFLIAALAFSITQIFPEKFKKFGLTAIIALFLVGYNIYSYQNTYEKFAVKEFDLSNASSLAISDVIDRYTNPESAAVIFGANWNSEITYYSKRKTFTVPDWFKSYDSVWKSPSKFIVDRKLEAIVFIQNDTNISNIKTRADVQKDSCLFKVFRNCYIWLPGVREIEPPEGVTVTPDLFINVFDEK